MKLRLPTLAAVLRLHPLLLLLLQCVCQVANSSPLRRNIIKVRASGFLPFESDLVLPLGILRQLQAQERASRVLPHQQLLYTKPARRRTKPKLKQKVRLERAHMRGGGGTDAGIQMYNLIDDDGELLLNLRVHSETNGNGNGNSLGLDHSLNAKPPTVDKGAPWRPSKWRPTAATPTITSSSPRPLPLHQYLTSSSNSLEHPSKTQLRRVFDSRHNWIYK